MLAYKERQTSPISHKRQFLPTYPAGTPELFNESRDDVARQSCRSAAFSGQRCRGRPCDVFLDPMAGSRLSSDWRTRHASAQAAQNKRLATIEQSHFAPRVAEAVGRSIERSGATLRRRRDPLRASGMFLVDDSGQVVVESDAARFHSCRPLAPTFRCPAS